MNYEIYMHGQILGTHSFLLHNYNKAQVHDRCIPPFRNHMQF